MKMKKGISFLFLFILVKVTASGQNSTVQEVMIDNGAISRIIILENGKVTTRSLRLAGYPYNFVSIEKEEPGNYEPVTGYNSGHGPDPEEFSFKANDRLVNGKTGWKTVEVKKINDGKGSGYALVLSGTAQSNKDLLIEIDYLAYPNLPVIRKKIIFENRGKADLKIDNIDTESLTLAWDNTHNVVYKDYARYKHLGPYTGDWNDPAVILHHMNMNRGILLGNEAPGVIKRTTSYLDGRTFTIGLTHLEQDFPSRVWLSAGEKWESPWSFIALYNDTNPRAVVDGPVSEFVRNHMGIRLAQIPVKPTFVYNTWKPFRSKIDDKLIRELADAAASCGVQEFVIDDGWQTNNGDWEIDYKKFPGGLKPVFDYIKSKGMKPGLWISMGAASVNSKVYKAHPEWFVKDQNQEPQNLHSNDKNSKTGCFTTGWKDYIKDKILGLVKEHGLEYVKLDLAIAASAYMFDKSVSGCYANNHSHRDREESYLEIYRAAWQLFDELHSEAPNLFIDCTFETMGTLQLIDYDMCKHAEGDWLSNFEAPAPDGSLRVRQMAWWRSPVIPAAALVIGNQSMDDEMALFSFKSLCGSLPIMLGDPRGLSPSRQKEFRDYSGWLQEMQLKHNVMLYRQDLKGFGEPFSGQWDGFQRINTDSGSGGIVGVFRQDAAEDQRTVTIRFLDPVKIYSVKEAVTGNVISTATGVEMSSKGFIVRMENKVDAKLYEVSELK